MNLLEIILIGVALAMDAFAISMCKGMSFQKISLKNFFIISIYFGTFQALMPIIGYFIGNNFLFFIRKIDHWISFLLLTYLGIELILEKHKKYDDNMNIKTMLLLSLATSIDALTVGITFSFYEINLLEAVTLIGIITFFLSLLGTITGHFFGVYLEAKAKIMGGLLLIGIGIKILIEHLIFLA